MSFKEWLPFTGRNRVALGLSALSLGMFITWNCLPYYESVGEPSVGITAAIAWPVFFDADNYLDAIQRPDVDGLLEITAFLGIILGGLVVLLAVPLWQILHASNLIKLPIAVINLFGAICITWIFYGEMLSDPAPYWIATILLMSLSLFSISAAFFVFKNELALRETRSHALPLESE